VAEQVPGCVNPLLDCAQLAWYQFAIGVQVFPGALTLDADGKYVATPLLTEMPTIENGGVAVGPPFKLTYKLRSAAVWEDGSPITSADFEFTWRAMMSTPEAIKVGYEQIDSIDTTDAKTVVIKYKKPFAGWRDLFGIVLKKAAFPAVNASAPDLTDEMQTGIPFAGGPWRLESFDENTVVLVKNSRYYGKVPAIDRVKFIHADDSVAAILASSVAAIYPPPGAMKLSDQVASDTKVMVKGGSSTAYEALWFNHAKPPLDDPKVREALMYAIDRKTIVDTYVKPFDPNAQVLGCGATSLPTVGPWCSDQYFGLDAFPYDSAKARQLLTAAGYDCSQAGQPCSKGGAPLTIDYATNKNPRRLGVQQLLVDPAQAAGFKLVPASYDAGTFFGMIVPMGQFNIANFAYVIGADPSVTFLFSCDAVTSHDNPLGWCDTDATTLMKQSDAELDPAMRLSLMNQIYAIEKKDFMSLPLFVPATVAAWRSDRIAGPIGTYVSSPLGLFANMNEWTLVAN
jgi:peptide/nickel transport system substrate-binding protein